ncbi:MAG TPA: hypothetical protein PKK43_05230 [Spirochaetota bacterium]|nr:hypothetical protein [Spirochaetota bacterium]
MKKSLIIAMLAAFTFAAATAGLTAASKKAANPLLGTWTFFNGMASTSFTFSENQVVLHFENEGGAVEDYTMKYTYKKSPIALTFKNSDGKVLKLSMRYNIKGDKLTYRFLNTKGKEIPGLRWEFSQVRTPDGHADGDIVLTRDLRKEQEAAREAAKVIIGQYSLVNMNSKIDIEFTEDTATFSASPAEGGNPSTYKMHYAFTKSPLTLTYTDEKGKESKFVMTYKISENKLTYRFTTVGKNVAFDESIYCKRMTNGKKAPADMEADKQEMH